MTRIAVSGVALAVSLCSVACTRTQSVPHAPATPPGSLVTLSLKDGRTVRATSRPTPEGLSWVTRDGKRIKADHVVALERRNHGRGAVNGLVTGLLVGATAGVMHALTQKVDCDDDGYGSGYACLASVPPVRAPLQGILGAGLGGLGGLFVGALIGGADRYELPGYTGAPQFGVGSVVSGESTATLSWTF